MSPIDKEWTAFNSAALERPPRELLRRTLGCSELDGQTAGVAVDLGCGSGAETLELLRRGWVVHAVDSDKSSLEMLAQRVPAAARTNLHLHQMRYEDFTFALCDLVWAGMCCPSVRRHAGP